MVATSQARSHYCPLVLPEHQAMRSCPTWAMGNVLGVQGDKAILGHTGESDHFDHSRPIRGYHRDRKPSSSSPINTIKRQRKNHQLLQTIAGLELAGGLMMMMVSTISIFGDDPRASAWSGAGDQSLISIYSYIMLYLYYVVFAFV